MSRPFLLLFAGLLLAVLDVPVGRIDVLPDVLGFALAAAAAHALRGAGAAYRVGRDVYLAGVLVEAAWLALAVVRRAPALLVLVHEVLSTLLLAGGTLAVLTAALWAARDAALDSLALQLRNRRIYVLVVTVALVLSALALPLTLLAARWVVFFSAAQLIVYALVLAAVVRADRELPRHGLGEPARTA